MPNRDNKTIGLIEDDMADIAAGQFAADRLWTWIHTVSHRLNGSDIDRFSAEMRLIEAALRAGRRNLQAQRQNL